MELTQIDFDNLRREIHRICGLDIKPDKHYLVRQRLTPVAREFGCGNMAELYRMLASGRDPKLTEEVVAAITTNETSFFRDGHPYWNFRDHILPQLLANRKARLAGGSNDLGAKINILSAGTSTGQEPVSLSILINEHARWNSGAEFSPSDFAITAVDISTEVLQSAEEGKFSQLEIERGWDDGLMPRYFQKQGEHWFANPEVMALIRFHQVNLTETIPSMGQFDVVFCRNVLIYFNEETRERILGRFHEMLCEDGYLIVGASELLLSPDPRYAKELIGDTTVYRAVRAET